ncbi:ATP-binding cassette domain-containing protein [Ligilactobacillus faecis]|uniref:ATP-binding cassette domain-containing protein n=1 Tax=Ligilactobacillus faecis TaxID=762833 RepID=UPI002468379D|nr:ATP-binding cassette domain-containing protein [Ligilactobacillus faecis]WGN90298.1 ATP-binding cassette domain-containing protein [Ligilactobacillus faecis]
MQISNLDNLVSLFEEDKLNILTGKNGSGKSTLLDQLAGLGGQTSIFSSKSIAYKLQKNYFFPDLTVAQTLALYDKMTIDQQHKKWLAQFYQDNIQDNLRVKMGNLSGGQQQLVLDYGILLLKRDVYLLDEPLTGIDEKNARSLYEIFVDIAQSKDKMVIVVEHDRNIIDTYKSVANIITL